MFESITRASPDPILGLTESFKQDPNPEKINLSVGVYKDDQGKTPILNCVKTAERQILESETTKMYLAIDGDSRYGRYAQQLLLGEGHDAVSSRGAATLQTPGGTGALRVAADFIKAMFPKASVWLSRPTWPNHPNIFAAAGITVQYYPYLSRETLSLDVESMIAALSRIPPGDVVLLHPCCHNPTGVDPADDDWARLADVIAERQLLPLVDFAYQGFAQGLNEDARGLRQLAQPGRELLICSSFSKNFGLYSERVGALTVVAATEEAASAALSQLKRCVRSNYSNPPAHGAAIVATILGDQTLRAQWEQDVGQMRDRINGNRGVFAATMKSLKSPRDFSFIRNQRGMFSLTGLEPEQIDVLRERHSIYIVRDGRINVAGMTSSSMERLCRAIISVL